MTTTLSDTFATAAGAAQPDRFLRRVLVADAITCAAMGALLLPGAGPLERLLGLPATLLVSAGMSLLPCAAFIALVATRDTLLRSAVAAIIGLNALWVIGSILLLTSAGLGPTALGYAFTIAQAAVVAIFAELEYVGLRRC